MKFTAKITLLGMERFDIEGNKVVKVYVQPDADDKIDNETSFGVLPQVYKGDWDLLQQIRTFPVPCQVEASLTMVQGSKKAATPYINSLKLLTTASSAASK